MENEFLKKYFLGLLNVEETEQLELQILEDSNLEENLLQAENDLIEDYLEDNLASDQVEAFNQNFLVTDERWERVEFLRVLKNKAQSSTETQAENPSFFEQLKAFLTWRPIGLAVGAIILTIGIGIGWRLIFNNSQSGIETEIVTLNKQDLSNLEEFKDFKNLSLASDNLRSTGNAKALSKQELTDKILLRLALPNTTNPTQNFTVKVIKDGKVLESITRPVFQNQEVRLLLPKSMLNQGEYQITLEKDSEKYNYYFAVQ